MVTFAGSANHFLFLERIHLPLLLRDETEIHASSSMKSLSLDEGSEKDLRVGFVLTVMMGYANPSFYFSYTCSYHN